MENKLHYLNNLSGIFDGIVENIFSFINNEQLQNKQLWKKFVDVFRYKEDSNDLAWRCEYWGKTMRGACLCYQYEKNDELYKVLEETVYDLLSTQDELGRISSYSVETEFQQWDMWGRKYVMTSLLHFYDICKDELLKEKIINALKKHGDYIISKIGNENGKTKITETSHFWLGVNSASILEPFVNLYKVSKDEKYLIFAKYIIDEGGIKEGNLLEEVRSGIHKPFEYPEAKAYETMSFFEGVLEYADVTDNKELRDLAIKFFEDVNDVEISIIGCAGSNEECFSNTKLDQLNKTSKFMQETCVTVTWMRILTKLMLKTGEMKYYERFSKSLLNAFIGSINFNHQNGNDYYGKCQIEPLPFDSYSPLTYGKRGVSTGGLQRFKDGSAYGCCACIGSAGVGLLADTALLENEDALYINNYFNGRIANEDFTLQINGTYFKTGETNLNISSKKNVYIRIPAWANKVEIVVNNEKIPAKSGDYLLLGKGKLTANIKFNPKINVERLENAVAFTYGDLVLAIDEENNPNIDISSLHAGEIKNFELTEAKDTNFVAFKADYHNQKIIFKDYSSCGKRWNETNSHFAAWINL